MLNLCVIAWQAVVAVAPAPGSDPPQPNNDGKEAGLRPGPEAMDVVDDAEAGAASSGEPEARRSPGEGGGAVESGCIGGVNGSGSGRRSSAVRDGFGDDALRDLVRCLCGVVVGRWNQSASTTAKAPKKVWVLHAMEAVHALVRTLEVSLGCGNTV